MIRQEKILDELHIEDLTQEHLMQLLNKIEHALKFKRKKNLDIITKQEWDHIENITNKLQDLNDAFYIKIDLEIQFDEMLYMIDYRFGHIGRDELYDIAQNEAERIVEKIEDHGTIKIKTNAILRESKKLIKYLQKLSKKYNIEPNTLITHVLKEYDLPNIIDDLMEHD